MAHEPREPPGGQLGGQGHAVAGAFGGSNEHRERELLLEPARRLHYPATKADVVAEARRQRVLPQLEVLLGWLHERVYVSPEYVTDEADPLG